MNPSLRLLPRSLTLALALIAAAPQTSAAQSSAAQSATPSVPQVATGSISGYITDSDGDSIPSAIVTLTLNSSATPKVALTATDGSFTFANVPPGPFKLSITASNFAPQRTDSELHPGEALDIPAISLAAAASSTNVSVTASQVEIAEAQVHLEEQQRVLGVFPNFYVSYVSDPVPMTPAQKYQLALRTLVDPVSFILTGVTAASQQADDIYDWGQGAQGFAKRYAAAYGTFLTSDLLGNAVLPTLLHQDPRYFYKGKGSIHSRILYAIVTTVVCKGDNHRWQPDYSGILGGLAASGISNAYYPASDRSGPRLIFEGTAIGIGSAAIQNIIQEFLVRRLTPHIPPSTPIQ